MNEDAPDEDFDVMFKNTPTPPDTEDEKLRKLVDSYTKSSSAMKPAAQAPMSSTNEAYEKLKQAMMNSMGNTNPSGLGTSNAPPAQFLTPGIYAHSSSISIATPVITSSTMSYNTAIGAPYQATPKSKKAQPQPTNEPEWRLVLGMILDRDTNNQKYITKSYFCVSKKEAKSYFKDDHEGKKFTAIFVLEDD